MLITRAEFLKLALAAAPAAICVPQELLAQGAGDATRTRVAAVIAAYDGQGHHRTGTDVDNRSARWLADEVQRAGGSARLEPFTVNRVDVRAALLRTPGQIIEGLPLFDGGFTDAAGVSGRLGAPSTLPEIALVRFDQAGISSEGQSIAEMRRSTTYRAIVAITEGTTPGLSPSNAASFARPYGLPVLQVGSEHQAVLGRIAQVGDPVNVVIHAERTSTTAQNVVASIAGLQPALAPLVVMTPRSGWWTCAAERGGGIACWLEAIRALAISAPARPVLFVASSGHELGHYGLDAFISARPGLITQASAWVHLGANIGAANGSARLQSSDDEVERVALEALQSSGATIRQRVARGTVPGGEARNIHIGGGRYVSLLGSGPLFHNIGDRWPVAVDLDAVERFTAAVSGVVLTLAKS